MTSIRYVLIGDGPSDAVLVDVINWSLEQVGFVGDGDFLHAKQQPPKIDLRSRIAHALAEFPQSRIAFVHRDAERAAFTTRYKEIERALPASEARARPCVAIVPVRMTEAWLLTSEKAIRGAAGNPNGRVPLSLPKTSRLEALPNPKNTLLSLLREAKSSKPRLRRKFDAERARYQVPRYTPTFRALRALGSFSRFEEDLRAAIQQVVGEHT